MKEKNEVKTPISKSESVSRTWTDPDVRRARLTRNRVTVTANGNTTEYNSVKDAFLKLGLPLGKRFSFRKKLKAAGSLPYGELNFSVLPETPKKSKPPKKSKGKENKINDKVSKSTNKAIST